MIDLSVQQPVFQPSTPTSNGHKSPEPATTPKAPSAARRPGARVIAAAALLVAGLAGFGVWRAFFAAPAPAPGVIAVLVLIATVLVGFSAWRFRDQLS
jgi:hypothetical protein